MPKGIYDSEQFYSILFLSPADRILVTTDMNHIEAQILEFVAKLYPEVFGPLGTFCASHSDFIDRTVAAFDREIQFYFAWLEYIAPLRVGFETHAALARRRESSMTEAA